MAKNIYYHVALQRPVPTLFDYLPPHHPEHELEIGSRVKVPFGSKEMVGIILGKSDTTTIPPNKLKPISLVFDEETLFPGSLCQFISKVHQYYHHAIGEITFTALPQAIKQGKPSDINITTPPTDISQDTPLTLNDEQAHAVKAINQENGFAALLLFGVTGSGKTEVYLQSIEKKLSEGKQCLVLVPEIALTPQTVKRFESRFRQQVVTFHSQMTPKKRLESYMLTRLGKAKIVIGTRSAIFLPFTELGLIVVDEEHDASFKQQEGFRYSARDMSVLRAHIEKVPVVLGSATPSFESMHNAQIGKYQLLQLQSRINDAQMPQMQILDVRHKKLEGGLSAQLIHEIKNQLKEKKQAFIFINRRGFSPCLMCYECGWLATCRRCDAKLTYHQQRRQLICHHCQSQKSVPEQCPECQLGEVHPVGIGTQRLEETLNQIFADAHILRVDSDSTRKRGELENKLDLIASGEADIIIGTQLLAKGHHFPNLTLVAILDVDGGLFSADFRAVEKMGQLINQVAGRAGREMHQGKVMLQSQHPNHPLLQTMMTLNYQAFFDELMIDRAQCAWPPFSHLALVRASALGKDNPQHFLQNLKRQLDKITDKTCQVLGPVPAPMEKRQGKHHFQLLLQTPQRGHLQKILPKLYHLADENPLRTKVKWSLDVDPIDLF